MEDKPKLRISRKQVIAGNKLKFSSNDFVGQGGSGIVYRSRCKQTGEQVALKFFLPLYQLQNNLFTAPKDLADLQEIYRKEIGCLSKTNHPGIARFVDCGIYHPTKSQLKLPALKSIDTIDFCVTEYIEGEPFLAFVGREDFSLAKLLAVLRQMCEAFVYLHSEKEYLHGDVRSANVLIREATQAPVLIDFGLYKNLNFDEVEPDGRTQLLGDWDLFPKNLPTNHDLKAIKESGGNRRQIKDLAFPTLDVFQFGKLLEKATPDVARVLNSEGREFWSELVRRLTSWDEARRLDFSNIANQLAKLSSNYIGAADLEELAPQGVAAVTIQLPGTAVSLTGPVDRLINTRAFRRLSYIKQLACLDLVYPAAGYSRYVHCLKTYDLCVSFLPNLLRSPEFRFEFDTPVGRLCLLTSLLHDINHFPFLHVFQELPGEYLAGTDLVDLFCDGVVTRDDPCVYELISGLSVDVESFKRIASSRHHELAAAGASVGEEVAKSLVDSGADLDKLAYLPYDALFTGVRYGEGIDLTALLRAATVVQTENGWHLAYLQRAVPALESLILSRYWNFRTIYWHHTNRALIAMLRHVIEKVYVDGGRSVTEYIKDTICMSQDEVLRYLNERFRTIYGHDSVLGGLIDGRREIYKRVLSLRVPADDPRDKAVFQSLYDMNATGRQSFEAKMSSGIENFLKQKYKVTLDIMPEEVLVDVPGRRLDDIGDIHVQPESGGAVPIGQISQVAKDLSGEFNQLAKKARVFVSPRLSKYITREVRLRYRDELLLIASHALPASQTKDNVR